MIFLGCSEAEMIFLGYLKIYWTDFDCVSPECPQACNKLVQARKEHDFGLEELEMILVTQFWPVCGMIRA